MRPILLTPMYYGKPCKFMLPNGKIYSRVVRYNKANGLYVVVANVKYFEYEMLYDQLYEKEKET